MECIEVRTLPFKDRGVFACRRFTSGERIEKVPVLFIPFQEVPLLEKTVFFNYIFSWGTEPEHHALALGYGSLYNHSYEPNAKYIKHLDQRTLEFIALCPIEKDEEIMINYNGDPLCRDPLWFPVLI